jgi:hypothetical protein
MKLKKGVIIVIVCKFDAEIRYYDKNDKKIKKANGLCMGESLDKAAKNVKTYYGESTIEHLQLTLLPSICPVVPYCEEYYDDKKHEWKKSVFCFTFNED